MFPVKCVYTKPEGQRAYRGHYIASILAKKFNGFFYTFPRHPKELPIIILTVDCKNDVSKDLIVPREKVSDALFWLVRHNPAYKIIHYRLIMNV